MSGASLTLNGTSVFLKSGKKKYSLGVTTDLQFPEKEFGLGNSPWYGKERKSQSCWKGPLVIIKSNLLLGSVPYGRDRAISRLGK